MPHVLIIEDSYLFGQFVSDAAILAGARTVEVVETQAAAETAARRKAPAVVVADVRLRSGSGLRAVERIVADHDAIPIVYVTGYPADCDGRLVAGGMVIAKPVSHDTLRTSLSQVIAQWRRSMAH
ncbi:response regulator [Sphingomonas sp. RP10(2022)]|uniref:Response regulator n=1 Tax=Sphingomonas liriopis TaxID=2949094 RepID=A0A9X2HZ17_9SPHN|nr:response regulator [Sphingomonas liriopis]MCP3736203.1 response regulator [Sphingomonas liriopis]